MLRNLVLNAPATDRTLGAVLVVNFSLTCCNVLSKHAALEDLVNGLRLVSGYGMAGFEDAREGHVAVLADDAAIVRGVGDEVGVSGVSKGGRSREIHRQGDVFPADP